MYLPDGTLYNGIHAPGQPIRAYGWSEDQHLVDQGVLRYGLQVQYVDRLLGQMLDRLEDSGRMEQILLIVVSDHGLVFVPGRHRRIPVAETLAEVAHVPLFIKYPGQPGGIRDDRPIETIDIFPTVADVLGLPLDSPIEGQSLIARNWQKRPRSIFEAAGNIEDFEAALDMNSAIGRISRVIQPGRSAEDSIVFGFGRDFQGLDLAELELSPAPAGVFFTLERPEWYQSVDRGQDFLPARLTGTASGLNVGARLLIALNGIVAGVGEVFDGKGSVSAMLDPRLFRQGVNRLQVVWLHNGRLIAVPVPIDTQDWRLQQDASGAVAAVSLGRQRWVAKRTLQGLASSSPKSSPVASITGWAFDPAARVAPRELLLVDGDRVVSTGFQQQPRALEAIKHGLDENLPIGFSIPVDPQLRKHMEQLVVLALFEDGSLIELASGRQPDR
jgi:hypothetical protein